MKILITLFILYAQLSLFSQNFWRHTGGPFGGSIGDIAINSNGELFAGISDESSFIFRSSDNGTTWQKINIGFGSFHLRTIGIGKNDDIFLGTDGQGIFRSTDNGETWTKKDNGYTSLECWTIAFNDSGDIFASNPSWYGIYKSTDNGENWHSISNINALTISINLNGDIYAGSYEGLYKSTNNGNTWEQLTNGLPNLTSISSISFNDSADVIVGTGYLYEGDGLYYSDNDGNSWINIGLSDTTIRSIVIKNNKFFVSTISGILSSSDNGITWQKLENGIYTNDIFLMELKSNGDLFIGAETSGGIYKSSDDGVSWEQIGLPVSIVTSITSNDKDNFVFTGSWDGIHRLDLMNGEWKNLGFLNRISGVAVKNDSILFAATYHNGLYRSLNNGETWEQTTITADSLLFIESILVSPDGALIIMTSNYPRISYDDGITWEKWTNGFPTPYVYGAAINLSNNIFIHNSRAVFHSTNSGTTFQTISANNDIETNGLAVNNQSNVFIADKNEGIFRSLDTGITWQRINDLTAHSILITNSQSVYSGVHLANGNEGVIASNDNGLSWNEFSTGLDQQKAIYVFHQNKNGYLFAGSNGEGLYISSNPITDIDEIKNISFDSYFLFQNYPNPFNPTTKISWQSPVSSLQTLKVYDVLGNEVATLVNEFRNAGNYEFVFDGSKLSSGVYFYRLKVGDFLQTKKMILIK